MKKYNESEKIEIGKRLLDQMLRSEYAESSTKFAVSVGLVGADITNIRKLNWQSNPQLIGDNKWDKIAKIVGYTSDTEDIRLTDWVYTHTWYNKQLYQQFDMSRMLRECRTLTDMPGIGKTVSAKRYKSENNYVYYIPCYEYDTNKLLIEELARQLGIKATTTRETRRKIVTEIKTLKDKMPLIILDEAGDLSDSGVRIIKYLYNELVDEGLCGLYIMGSDGLEKKLNNGKRNNTHGFTEALSRMDNKTVKVLKVKSEAKIREYLELMAVEIAEVNGATSNQIEEIKAEVRINMDLRKVRSMIRKWRYQAQLRMNN